MIENEDILDLEKVYEKFNKYRMSLNIKKALECYELLKNNQFYYENNKEKIDYEMTILYYYCFPNKNIDGAKFLIEYINNFTLNLDNVWNNLKFYTNILKNNEQIKIKNLQTLDLKNEKFNNSTPCKLITKSGDVHLNIRYVNYKYNQNNDIVLINEKPFFIYNPVITRNLYNGEIEFKIKSDKIIKSDIIGFEDIRLFEKNNQIKFLATAKGYNEDQNQYNIITGEYNIEKKEMILEKVFNSPDNSSCEKNWVMLNESEIIYKWSPIRIYDYETLIEKRRYNVPKIFNFFRGSTNIISVKDFLLCLVHTIHLNEQNKRKYLHWLIKLNKNGEPLEYSTPFSFENNEIEYCLSINYLQNENIEFHYSLYDSESKSLEISLNYFDNKFIKI